MSGHLNGFNPVAHFYDFFKRIVFGRTIYESKTHFLRSVDAGRNILIIGGGSGETLPLLLQLNPESQVWFLDASSEMLRLAKRRMKMNDKDNIRFIHSTKDHLPTGIEFDTVISDFLLDLFSDREVARMAHRVTERLRPGGVWLVADFVDNGKAWQKMMLWMMYRFFTIACKIEATRLPAWQDRITSVGMQEVSATAFYRGFIKSTVYRKA